MAPLTHTTYFCKYKLSVEQYGEILVAQLFNGTKHGDAQPGYDVTANADDVASILSSFGSKTLPLRLGDLPVIRIEVKSKVSCTENSKATVIHCNDNKFCGVTKKGKQIEPMTHLAVVIVRQDNGYIENAWLMTHLVAMSLRVMESKSRYIPVSKLRKAALAEGSEILDFSSQLREVADRPLSSRVSDFDEVLARGSARIQVESRRPLQSGEAVLINEIPTIE